MAMAQELAGGGGGRARERRACRKVMTWPQHGQRMAALSGRDSTTPPARRIWRTLGRKLQGYWNYYGVIGNSERLPHYGHEVKGLVFKWLNRRSQRKSYTWTAFAAVWESWKLPPPCINEIPPPRSARQRAPLHA